jgi:hypothetical protein
MAYVPGCDVDVFISYAHENNADGWVTRFRDRLALKLDEYLGNKPEVWFDEKRLRAGDPIRDEIQRKLKRTAFLAAVISPTYLRKEFCMRHELAWFYENVGPQVIQVIKVPLDEDQKVPLGDLLFERFYDQPDGGPPEEFDAGQDRFESQLRKIAWNISARLKQMRKSRQKIYLAKQDDPAALMPYRDQIWKEFHGQGYSILPDEEITRLVSDTQIRGWLEQCDLSIHLFGDGQDEAANRQLALAQQGGRPRLLCGNSPATLPRLVDSGNMPLLLGGVTWKEDLIARVRTALSPTKPEAVQSGKPFVYLVCDRESNDYDCCYELKELIQEDTAYRDYEVELPAGLRDSRKLRRDHEEKLQRCDGVMLYWGEAEPGWFQLQDEQLVRACVEMRRQFGVEAKYLRGGRSAPSTRGELILRQRGEQPKIDDLRPFLDRLQQRRQASQGSPA